MSKELTWRKAIEKVLGDAPEALRGTEIADKISADGLRLNMGATPANTVFAIISTAIKNEGDDCPFQKVGRGLFVWKGKASISGPSKPAKSLEEDEDDQYDI